MYLEYLPSWEKADPLRVRCYNLCGKTAYGQILSCGTHGSLLNRAHRFPIAPIKRENLVRVKRNQCPPFLFWVPMAWQQCGERWKKKIEFIFVPANMNLTLFWPEASRDWGKAEAERKCSPFFPIKGLVLFNRYFQL